MNGNHTGSEDSGERRNDRCRPFGRAKVACTPEKNWYEDKIKVGAGERNEGAQITGGVGAGKSTFWNISPELTVPE